MWMMKSFGLLSLLWTLYMAPMMATAAATTTMTSNRILQDPALTQEPTQDQGLTDDQAMDGSGTQEETPARTNLVRLLPFDVLLAMTGDPEQVNLYSLLDIVQEWMTDSFAEKASNDGLIAGSNSTTFNSLGLVPRIDDGDDATAAADNTNGGGGGRGRKKNRLLLRRQLQDFSTLSSSATSVSVFTANFEGVSLWNRLGSTTSPLDPEIVQLIQRATFLEDDVLLAKLRSADAFTGLGSNVVDVKVFVVSTTDETTTNTDDSEEGIGSDPLQIIIIIAIVVACLAFALLMFAVIWAWRTDQARRDYSNSKGGGSKNANNYDRHGGAIPQIATKSESYEMDIPIPRPPSGKAPPAMAITTNKKNKKGIVAAPVTAPVPTTTATTSNYTNTHSYDNGDSTDVSEMPSPADYDGSVISEDISTSLTAYYRSGVAGYAVGTSGRQGPSAARGGGGGDFNDNASMSSMDSYGYSLDGYAPSLGPAPQGYPVGSSLYNGLIKDPDTDYSEEEDEAQDYSNMNSTTDTGRVNV